MAVRKRPAADKSDAKTTEQAVPDVTEAPVNSVADSAAASGGFDWDNLFDVVEVESVAVRPSPVEVPSPLVELLRRLDQPGPGGGRQRGKLPVVSVQDFKEKRRLLQAAVNKLGVPRSIMTQAVYAPDDLMEEEYIGSSGKPRKRTVPREAAVPTHITFTVGERRGRKTDAESGGDTD